MRRHRAPSGETYSVKNMGYAFAGSILSATLLWMAFPPVDWGWLAWVALVPLVLVLRSARRPRQGCATGFLWGTCFYGILLWWMQEFVARWTGSFWLGLIAWGALVLSQTVFSALFGWGYVLANSLLKGPALPIAGTVALWTAVEWLRGAGWWGFLWGQVAVTQHRNLLPLQSVELLGSWGLSAWIVLVNAATAEAVARRKIKPLLVTAEVSLLLLLFGWWRLNLPAEPDRISALVVQPNVDTTSQWNQQMQEAVKASIQQVLSRLRTQPADIVLFPESIVPDATAYPFSDLLAQANRLGATVLIGTFVEEYDKSYNTVTAFLPDGTRQSYRKQHLVPWGEYVPLRRWTPWVEHFGVVSADVSPGGMPELLTPWRIGTPICFESALPSISWAMVRQGARLLCVVTNDTWFGRSPAAEQHLAFCALRAVETRRWVLRSATTGISAVFDARGQRLQRAELFQEAYLYADGVELRQERTLYTRLGDTGSIVVLIAICIVLGWFTRTERE